jgi:hypothetical protein
MNVLQYLDSALVLLAPMLTEIIALALSALFAWVLMAVKKYVGLKGQAILRDALNQAIATGAKQAPDNANIAEAAEAAVEYARRSSPGTIKDLGVIDSVLFDKARAAIKALK